MSSEFATLLPRLMSRERIGLDEMRAAFDKVFDGAWTPVQVGAFVVSLRMRGESADEIVAAAQAMRAAMIAVEHDLPVVMDTCGTGGDGAHTLNLSSGAAIVIAACGIVVAKHGNRSASSRCGSADVFEKLGIPLDIPPSRQGQVLREAGITFLYAQAHHPALKHVGQARRELGTRTLFNALGPLANPARATHQLIGVYDDALRGVAAHALRGLGSRRAWVVRGEDGLDEVSPCGPTRVAELTEDGEVRDRVVTPQDFGLEPLARSAIAGGEVEDNARALSAIVDGEKHPARLAVVLNAAAALAVVTGDDPRACMERARSAIDSGGARATFERWRRAAIRARGT